MPDTATTLTAAAVPHIEYRRLAAGEVLPPDVLCAVTFGGERPPVADRRLVRVGLEPLRGGGITEIWHASGPVRVGFDGPIRYAADADHLAGAIELDERAYGGILGAA
ncbi:MAG TPA: hypothetical protein VJ011_02900, partial [Steroidobacteraceae bacterium]|nr:hypothetical protein [Steroidobacteraceae bacterium]